MDRIIRAANGRLQDGNLWQNGINSFTEYESSRQIPLHVAEFRDLLAKIFVFHDTEKQGPQLGRIGLHHRSR